MILLSFFRLTRKRCHFLKKKICPKKRTFSASFKSNSSKGSLKNLRCKIRYFTNLDSVFLWICRRKSYFPIFKILLTFVFVCCPVLFKLFLVILLCERLGCQLECTYHSQCSHSCRLKTFRSNSATKWSCSCAFFYKQHFYKQQNYCSNAWLIIMKIKIKRSHGYDINRRRPEHGHKYSLYWCLYKLSKT